MAAKGPKTSNAPPALIGWANAGQGWAGQLAALRQGPPIDKSVRPWGRAAGVRNVRINDKDVRRETKNPPAALFLTFHVSLLPQCASSQEGPCPASTVSGIDNCRAGSVAASITCLITAVVWATAASSTSNSNSSWTVNSIFA